MKIHLRFRLNEILEKKEKYLLNKALQNSLRIIQHFKCQMLS